jgi:hypothetical protein
MHGFSSRIAPESSSGRAGTGTALAALAVAFVAACAPAGRAPPAERVLPGAPAAPAGARYRIDAARSDVRILVYRAGPLASLGHNHVLRVRGLEGQLWLPADPAAARFALRFPVAALALDEPDARREEGAEFADLPSAEDIAGTRRNLEGPAVLDAARHPDIRLEGAAVRTATGLVARCRIAVRDGGTDLEVPVEVTTRGDEVVVRGGFSVTQSGLGIVPFSVALGALKVRDELAVRFRLVAVADPAGAADAEKP